MKKTLVKVCNGTEKKINSAGRQEELITSLIGSLQSRGNSDLVEFGATVAHKHLADLLGRIEHRPLDT